MSGRFVVPLFSNSARLDLQAGLSTGIQEEVPSQQQQQLWELVRNANPWLHPDLLSQHLWGSETCVSTTLQVIPM